MPYSPMRHAKRVITLVVGSTILLIGLAMIFLPGPGILGIAAGLGVLATEFVWAKRMLVRVRRKARDVGNSTWNRKK